jgi:hypothetical protein
MSIHTQLSELRFDHIIPTDEQIIFLYELLKLRNHNISHSINPSFSEHSNFVRNNPYRAWFLLRLKDRYIGSIYASLENSLGINILDPHLEYCLEPVIDKVMSELDPLPAVPSVRAGYFSIIVPFSNKVMAAKLETMGFIPSQTTYKKNST